MTNFTPLEVAQHHASLGKKVFPCKLDKTPFVKWKTEATSDPLGVAPLWSQFLESMIGLPTGRDNNLAVLDVDVDKETGEAVGEKTLTELGFQHLLNLPNRIRTPSGGWHIYFQHPTSGLNNSVGENGLGSGLDIRGEGGYVIAAGSRNQQGSYDAVTQFSFIDLPPFPKELLAILQAEKKTVPSGGTIQGRFTSMEHAVGAVRNAQEGARNDTLNRAAFYFGQLVGRAQLDEGTAFSRLEQAAASTDLPTKEAVKTITSGLKAGQQHPLLGMTAEEAFGGPAPNLPQAPTDPQPLMRETPPGAPYPIEALGPLLSAVKGVQGMVQAPIAIPAQSGLSVASLAVQGFANVETLGGVRPVSLYCMTIALSGERKSSCDAPLMLELNEFVRAQQKDHLQSMKKWEDAKAMWQQDHARILKDAHKETGPLRTGIEDKFQKLGHEPQAPRSPERIVSEPTFEGLTRLYTNGQPSLGIFSDEGGQFLGGHAMNKDNRQKTQAALNGIWQGEPIRRTRQGDGSIALHNRRLACHLMIQPGVAEGFLADPSTVDTGFLPRFLMCHPESQIGKRFQDDRKVGEFDLDPFRKRLREILKTPMPIDEETGELEPRTLQLSPGARKLLAEYSDRIEGLQLAPGKYATITGFASKSAEQAARIAGVLTLWEDLSASLVTEQVMEWGITLAEHYLDEALRLANRSEISRDTRDAEQLRHWLVCDWPEPEITRSEILQHGPNALRDGKRLDGLISALTENGWLRRLPQGTVVRGKERLKAFTVVRPT